MALGLTGLTQLMSGAGSDEDIWGKKPQYSPLRSYEEVLRDYVKGNRAVLPMLQSLGLESTEAYSKMMEKAYPGITEIKNLGTKQIASFLKGEIPDEVLNAGIRRAAEGGVGQGTGTGGTSNYLRNWKYRDLGLSQLAEIKYGIDSGSRWTAQAQNQTFDFSKMFPTTAEGFNWEIERENRLTQIANVKAAPVPAARGTFDTEMQWIGMILSAYGGGSGYKPQPYQGMGGNWGSPNAMTGSGGSYFGGGTTAGDFYGDYMNARGAGMLGG